MATSTTVARSAPEESTTTTVAERGPFEPLSADAICELIPVSELTAEVGIPFNSVTPDDGTEYAPRSSCVFTAENVAGRVDEITEDLDDGSLAGLPAEALADALPGVLDDVGLTPEALDLEVPAYRWTSGIEDFVVIAIDGHVLEVSASYLGRPVDSPEVLQLMDGVAAVAASNA